MTDFKMHVDVDYSVGSEYHENGRVEIQITLDEKSAVDFYQWLAEGCDSDLVFNKNGCRRKTLTTVTVKNTATGVDLNLPNLMMAEGQKNEGL